MKLAYIKFAHSVRVNEKQTYSANSDTSDIEIEGGGIIRIVDKRSKKTILSSVYNMIEAKEFNASAEAETKEAAQGSRKKKS